MSLSLDRLMRMLCALALILGLAYGLLGSTAHAQAAPGASVAAALQPAAAPATPAKALPSVNVGQVGGQPVSMPLQVLLQMTGITLLPRR